MPSDDDAPAALRSFDQHDRAAACAALPEWRRSEKAMVVDGIAWRPDLIDPEGRLLHLHLLPKLGRAWERRIAAALNDGNHVVVAAPIEYWYAEESVERLARLGVGTVVLEAGESWTAREHRSVARLVALEGILLPAEAITRIATHLLDDALSEPSSFLKGRKFEEVIAFVLSQTSFFQVVGFNVKNLSEEIDVLLKNRRVDDRAIPSAPLVIVSAKNEAATIGKEALVALVGQIDNKRGLCKLGFLCASRGIAKTVGYEDIGNRHGDRVVALLDGIRLRGIINDAVNLDDHVEQLIIEGAVR
jgi:hypothetical protein